MKYMLENARLQLLRLYNLNNASIDRNRLKETVLMPLNIENIE